MQTALLAPKHIACSRPHLKVCEGNPWTNLSRKLSTVIAKMVAMACRPINTVENKHLIRIASTTASIKRAKVAEDLGPTVTLALNGDN